MTYGKIRQPKLSDVIEQRLEHLIFEGTLRPGESCLLSELAKQFDVSRPSVREAIQTLEAKDLAAKVAEHSCKRKCGKALVTL